MEHNSTPRNNESTTGKQDKWKLKSNILRCTKKIKKMTKALKDKENSQLDNLRNQVLGRKAYLKRGERTQKNLEIKKKKDIRANKHNVY